MDPLLGIALIVVALLLGLFLGYEVRDRRFVKEIREIVRGEFQDQRDALAERIDRLEEVIDSDEE